MWTNLITIGAVLLSGLAYCLYYVGRRPKGYPPGPPTLPILGNLHQLSQAGDLPHLLYQKWAQEYGPIYSVILGNQVQIVLSSDQAIKGLIDSKGAIASSRPDSYVGQEFHTANIGAQLVFPSSLYTLPLTEFQQRKFAHYALHAKKIADYQPYLDLETKQLLFELSQDSTDVLKKIRRFTSSVMSSIVFGVRRKNWNDPQLQEFFSLVQAFSDLLSVGTAAFADFYPILRLIPAIFYPVKRQALELHHAQKTFYRPVYQNAKHAFLNKLPTSRPCVCNDIVTLQQTEGYDDDLSCLLAAVFLEAGSDTTSSTLYGFIQAMLLYPAAQRTAQAELDALCGPSRMPSIEDLPNLPYIRACVKETLRWMPAVPLAIPHALTESTEYMGYQLPRGASLLLNTYTIHNDPARYPNPEIFQPERFLGDNTSSSESSVLSNVSERDHFGFGSGRRICPGTHIADRSLATVMARLLWGFDLCAKKGEDGKEMLPRQGDLVSGIATRPKDFEVDFRVREGRGDIIRRTWEDVERGLDKDGQFVREMK
ncbi:hypothetical protein NX059_011539 [Plenodomus lindquistii]|nr:hypothetical protein NX059_011539 [Plenodomus lindquistii]